MFHAAHRGLVARCCQVRPRCDAAGGPVWRAGWVADGGGIVEKASFLGARRSINAVIYGFFAPFVRRTPVARKRPSYVVRIPWCVQARQQPRRVPNGPIPATAPCSSARTPHRPHG